MLNRSVNRKCTSNHGEHLFISTRTARKSQTIASIAKDVRKYTAGRDMKW